MVADLGSVQLAPAGRRWRPRGKISALFVAMALVLAVASASCAAVALRISPLTARPGGVVTISGSAGGGCRAGARVILVSAMFGSAANHRLGGKPAIYATVGRRRGFSASLRLSRGQPAGLYEVLALCRSSVFARARAAVL